MKLYSCMFSWKITFVRNNVQKSIQLIIVFLLQTI